LTFENTRSAKVSGQSGGIVASEFRLSGQRQWALIASGAVFFFTLMPVVLSSGDEIAGLPLPYLGLFVSWAAFIVAVWIASRSAASNQDP